MEPDKQIITDINKIFPLNGNDLFGEMTAYMPRCYFPTALGDDALQEFTEKEFCRIRNIISREYKFDIDKHIAENRGSSPFDLIRKDIEQEVYRRIRKDYMQLCVISIRDSLIDKIRCAVEKENNIIGTFYRNRGKHYQDEASGEYDTSPIVVTHNPDFFSYGGYESATLYELLIDGPGNLLCTLNGEGGEDFFEPIEHIQTEGLFEITHWLEEYGFIPDEDDNDEDDTVVCNKCGSSDIQTQAWVDPNTQTFIGTTGIDRNDNWCNQCADNQPFTTLKKFKERMQEWWEELEPSEMERITGLRRDRYPSREFVDVCNKWWDEKNYDEKRMILKKHNNDE